MIKPIATLISVTGASGAAGLTGTVAAFNVAITAGISAAQGVTGCISDQVNVSDKGLIFDGTIYVISAVVNSKISS